MNLKKIAAGAYEVISGYRYVTITRNPELAGSDKWFAYASWDKSIISDPVATKREAIAIAVAMLPEHAGLESFIYRSVSYLTA